MRSKRITIKRELMILIVAVLVIFTLVLSFTKNVVASNQNRKDQFNVVSVSIKEGDTLWSIANTYFTDDYKSISNYIDTIKECNHLATDSITIGMNIIVPYYEGSAVE